MKIKLLAVAVAGILLSGCNDDNGQPTGLSVQAFDPAVRGMTASVICDDGTSEGGIITGQDGNAKFFELTTLVSPETCAFTFFGIAGAIDVTNSKSMVGVTYTIPKGMVEAGKPVTASPLTTLIAKELKATGNPYSKEGARLVLVSLGLGSLIDNGVDVSKLLSNTDAVLKELSTTNSTDASLLAATTAVLSDVLANADENNSSTSVADLAKSTSALADSVIDSSPNYPTGASGGVVTITVSDADIEKVVDAVEKDQPIPDLPQVPTVGEEAKPIDKPTPTPPTGGGDGTGGTGGGGNGKVPS
ncbi:hypothetical protein [Moritella dasanensis]|uniref:hypothetical protein n=1 Tax=Moritella dasanensis TaxID=428031 RepID=UPI0003170977|nr:hypothetical protein [Moritella dasanensis]